jgi:hypothetical protein
MSKVCFVKLHLVHAYAWHDGTKLIVHGVLGRSLRFTLPFEHCICANADNRPGPCRRTFCPRNVLSAVLQHFWKIKNGLKCALRRASILRSPECPGQAWNVEELIVCLGTISPPCSIIQRSAKAGQNGEAGDLCCASLYSLYYNIPWCESYQGIIVESYVFNSG